MTTKHLLIAVVLLVIASHGAANAGKDLEESGALVCVMDKWDEKEPEKGHKLVDAVMRCGVVPDDTSLEKYAQDCTGKYEYMPDGTWRGAAHAPTAIRAGTRATRPGRKVRASRSTPTRRPGAPANIRARAAVAPICTRV
jgi:hypothetical protein